MPYFEDFHDGERTEFGSYTFTADNIKAFARRFDPQPFHLDDEAARKSVFGGLAASGWHTACACMRVMIDHMQGEYDAAVARGEDIARGGPSPGYQNLKWLRPVFAGDTVSYSSEVTSKRPSASRPQWGLVHSRTTGVNQHGEPVITFESAAFMPRRS